MIIKKFQGKTEADATEQAKKELGPNVVIMNVKNVKRKGIFAIFKPHLIEVTAALEEESERVSYVKKEEPVSVAESIPVPVNKAQPIFSEETIRQFELSATSRAKEPEKNESAETKAIEEKLLYNKMIENEVNETYANQIIEEMEKNIKPNMPFDQALANIYQKMILKFGKPETITPAKNGPKVVFFIGPTGVGKTTTIAKVASKFSVEGKKKVALLTTDTYRIAAAEQLRTYADILEVPFRVIYTVDEIENSMRDFKDYDYIFVDTAGHYSEMTEYKLIFTKLDETVTLGNLLNLKLYTGAPLSYVTCGQNVPDDIEQFNPQKTVKLLLGGKSK